LAGVIYMKASGAFSGSTNIRSVNMAYKAPWLARVGI
jgi:hypothetical protein